MNKLIKDNTGFTLVEILIAILIFSIVISTVFSSFNAFIISSEKIKEEVAHSEKIRNVFKRIFLDLESIFIVQPPRYQKPQFDSEPDPYSFVGKQIMLGQKFASTITFTSLAHVKFGIDQRVGVAKITYYLKENKNKSYDLYRSDVLPPFFEANQSCLDPVLIKNISGFEVIYKDFNNDEYKYWDSEDEELEYTFPATIDFKITFGSGEQVRVLENSIRLVTRRNPIE